MPTNQMAAGTIAEAARLDPQLQVPSRPRIRRGLSLDVTDQRVVVRGAPHRQRFTGRAARTVLPGLLPHLTGENDHHELQRLTGLSERHLFSTLTLLWTSGVIEDTPATRAASPAVSKRLADLMSRTGDSTGRHTAWEDAADALTATSVTVLGNTDLTRQVAAGLSEVEIPVRHATDAAELPEDSDLVVLVDAGAGIAEDLYRAGVPHLRFKVSGSTAHLGPYVDPTFTPCLQCKTADEVPDEVPPRDTRLAVALLTREVFGLLSGTTPTPYPMQWTSVQLSSLRQQRHSAPTRPGCSTCSVAPAAVPSAPTTAVRFEASVAFPPKEFVGVKPHQAHYKPSNLALQDRDKLWPLVRHQALTEVTPETLRTSAPGVLDERSIALLLALICGRDPGAVGRVQRWTASGGNIGSVIAHVVVRDVSGVEPGIYGYVPTTHSLALLSRNLDQLPGESPASIVLTGAFGKVASKYGAFALRIVLLDAGCAVTTTRLAARDLDITASFRDRWDSDQIATALSTAAEYEPVTAVIDLGGPR